MAEPYLGLTRTELERELRWLVRHPPSDPSKLVPFLADVIVEVLEANNKALAAHLARDTETTDAEAF